MQRVGAAAVLRQGLVHHPPWEVHDVAGVEREVGERLAQLGLLELGHSAGGGHAACVGAVVQPPALRALQLKEGGGVAGCLSKV